MLKSILLNLDLETRDESARFNHYGERGTTANEGEQAHLNHLRHVIEQDWPIIPFDFVPFMQEYRMKI